MKTISTFLFLANLFFTFFDSKIYRFLPKNTIQLKIYNRPIVKNDFQWNSKKSRKTTQTHYGFRLSLLIIWSGWDHPLK